MKEIKSKAQLLLEKALADRGLVPGAKPKSNKSKLPKKTKAKKNENH